jgi:hypothetical protein
MSTRNPSNWMPELVGPVNIEANGDPAERRRGGLNFVGATLEDDPDNDRINVTLPGGGAGSGSNLGSGLQVFKDVSAGTLRHRTIDFKADIATSGEQDANEVKARPSPPHHYNVCDYGADPTGVADSAPAFNAAIAAMGVAPTTSPFTPAAWTGRVLSIPAGKFRLASTLLINRQMIVQGVGGSGDYPATVLIADPGVTAVEMAGVYLDPAGGRGDFAQLRDLAIYHGSYNVDPSGLRPLKWAPSTAVTLGQFRVPSVVTGAGYALECTTAGTTGASEPAWPVGPALAFPTAGTTYSDGTAVWTLRYVHGLKIRAPYVRVENVQIAGFPSNGVDLVASYSGSPATYGSLSYFGHIRSHYNGGHGIFLAGDDSNAGVCTRSDFSNNQGFGVNARSFLNFTWIGVHAEGNEGGAPYYATSGDFFGCYAEGNQGAIVLADGSVTWTGGVAGAGLYDDFSDRYRTPWTATETVPALTVRKPTADNGYYYLTYAGGTTGGSQPTWPVGRGKTVVDGTVTWICYGLTAPTYAAVVGSNGRNLRALSVRTTDRLLSKMGADSSSPLAFQWMRLNPTSSTEEHGYALNYGGGGDWQFYQLQSAQNAAFLTTEGTSNWPQYGAGYFAFSRGFILGGPDGAYGRVLGGLAAPVAGAWVRGDIVFNTLPSTSTPFGWRCTASGTPGTWEALTAGGSSSFSDAAFEITDDGDATKKAKFQCSGISTGTTRTITVPNADGTMAFLGLAQTFSALQTFTGGTAFGSSVASTGLQRFGTTDTAWANFVSGGTDYALLGYSGGIVLFNNTSFNTRLSGLTVEVYGTASTNIFKTDGSGYAFTVAPGKIENGLPRVGMTTAYASEGRATQAMADANQTLGASIYSRRIVKFTGAITADRTATFPHPASEDASYEKVIVNDCTGAFNLVISTGTGTTVNVASGGRAVMAFTPDGVMQIAT